MFLEKLLILMTCHERKEKTLSCIESLQKGLNISARFIVADADSKDGTVEALSELPHVTLIKAPSNVYWNGGMRLAFREAVKQGQNAEYVLLVNDDVVFYPGAVEKLIRRMEDIQADAVVGATENEEGEMTYGGVRMKSKLLARYELIPPSEEPVHVDTFNCNCLLVRYNAFRRMGNLDKAYVHSMGDYDYGMRMRRKGLVVINSAEYAGKCSDNDKAGSWRDRSLSGKERLKLKESAKGLPYKDWYHFVKKNYSLPAAIYHSITPYVRILLGR